MKTAAKVALIVAAVFILLGIVLTVGGIALNGQIDTVLQNMDGDLNMNFRVGTDGIHFGHGPSTSGGHYEGDIFDDDIFDDDAPHIPDPDDIIGGFLDDDYDDDYDDKYDDSEFMDELEDAFEDAGISEKKLHELMNKYNLSESDIKNKMDEYNISLKDLRRAMKLFGVNENNIDEFIEKFINGDN